LSDHPGDIPFITYKIIGVLKKKHNLKVNYISPGALKLMKNYDWPGNVRELENILERASLLSDGSVLTSGDILPLLKSQKSPKTQESIVQKDQEVKVEGFSQVRSIENEKSLETQNQPKTLKEIEKNAILEAMSYAKWNMSKASKILGVSRMTLYRKMRTYEIEENE
jgi:DNA-binding NtrC family response regulator